MMVKLLLPFATLLLVIGLVHGQTNVTVDDTNPTIIYTPSGAWTTTEPIPLDFPWTAQSSHSVTTPADHPGALATFTFTGIAVYYFSPLWPYAVNSLVSIDGETGTCVNLFDPNGVSDAVGHETVNSTAVWFRTGLANTQHTVAVSACPSGQYIVVDGFIYTTQGTASTSAHGSGTLTTSTSTVVLTNTAISTSLSDNSSTNSSKHVVAIAVGAAIGGIAILALILIVAIFFCTRKRDPTDRVDLPTESAAYTPVPQVPVVQATNPPMPMFLGSNLGGQLQTNGLYDPYTTYPQSIPSDYRSSYPSTVTSGVNSTPKYPQLPEL